MIDLAPPLVALGKLRGWAPLPLTIKEGRGFAQAEGAGQGPGVRDQGLGDKETRRLGDSGRSHHLKHQAASITVTSQAPSPQSPASVAMTGLHFSYGEHEAIYDLSLAARPGEVLALMGRNGSGKTTLLKLIVGLLRPQRGTIAVLGRDVTRMDVEDVAALVGYVPQDPHALLFHDTVREELEFTLQNREPRTKNQRNPPTDGSRLTMPVPILGSSAEEQVVGTLSVLGLSHLAAAYPRDLSGGEAQRAALAAILVADPPVLLLDEPTRGLDYAAKAVLGRLLRRLAADGRTIIMSTHDVELVAAYADHVALMGDGELVVEGGVRAVLGDSLIFSSQIAKLYRGSGWLTVDDVVTAGSPKQ
jgi:energy-coupling factor transport system ATP-binding protein